jgi:hypothetical protein
MNLSLNFIQDATYETKRQLYLGLCIIMRSNLCIVNPLKEQVSVKFYEKTNIYWKLKFIQNIAATK